MRQIEFRAKRVLSGEWAVGHLLQTLEQTFILVSHNSRTQLCPNDEMTLRLHDKDIAVIEPHTVGQFTGYADYLGNDIYEGDILHCLKDDMKHAYRSVVYQRGCFCLHDWFSTTPMSNHHIKSWKVVGNIFDCPELLDIVNGNKKGGQQ
ncbi:MAG: YopX family protein [Muribaculaceae bacterium]|nr:YopX family protein [Muribaculaceae bacterium]